jgi:IS30 family transposase
MEALLKEGHTQKSIAEVLKVDESTISRERHRVKRKNGAYDAESSGRGAAIARSNSKYQGMKIESDSELKNYIIERLKEKRSPDEISGRMRKEKQPFYTNKNAIYDWLWSAYGQRYCKYLCTQRYGKKNRTGKSKREMIPDLVSFREAPQGSLNKTRYGHGEVDTMVSPRAALGKDACAVVTLKKEKLLRLRKIPNMRPVNMAKTVRKICRDMPVLSLIGDRGIENKKHRDFGVPTYGCDPHSPWQKPHVENQNGLVRKWWFPKGTDWSLVSVAQLQEAEDHLNNKWRKSLAYASANEIARLHGILKREITN